MSKEIKGNKIPIEKPLLTSVRKEVTSLQQLVADINRHGKLHPLLEQISNSGDDPHELISKIKDLNFYLSWACRALQNTPPDKKPAIENEAKKYLLKLASMQEKYRFKP